MKEKQTSLKKILISCLAGILILGAGIVQAAETIVRNQSIDMDTAANFCFIDARVDKEDVVNLDISFDRNNRQYYYEVEFDTEKAHYEYEVHAQNGTILSSEIQEFPTTVKESLKTETSVSQTPANRTGSTAEKTTPTAQTYISVDRAKLIAVSDCGLRISDVTFSEAKLEEEDGTIVYEIEFYTDTTNYSYEINPWTGKILESYVKQELSSPAPTVSALPVQPVNHSNQDNQAIGNNPTSATFSTNSYKYDDDRWANDDDWDDDDEWDDEDDWDDNDDWDDDDGWDDDGDDDEWDDEDDGDDDDD